MCFDYWLSAFHISCCKYRFWAFQPIVHIDIQFVAGFRFDTSAEEFSEYRVILGYDEQET